MSTLQFRDPQELTIHPVAKCLPELGKEDPRFIALVEDIRLRGIDNPLKIDKQNRIADGRHRNRAGKVLQLERVPVMVVSDEEVLGIVVNSPGPASSRRSAGARCRWAMASSCRCCTSRSPGCSST